MRADKRPPYVCVWRCQMLMDLKPPRVKRATAHLTCPVPWTFLLPANTAVGGAGRVS